MTSPRSGSSLSAAARARLARIKASGTWDSALSVDEFAAIRSVGFEPVGQVFGAEVYSIGAPGGTFCPQYSWQARPARDVFRPTVGAEYDVRAAAIRRMTAECAALGGHGVVGVSLTVERPHPGWFECTAIGTAIRAQDEAGLVRGAGSRAPFTCGVTGQDFAKLFMGGSIPVCLVFGISIWARHDDWLSGKVFRGVAGKLAGNVEVDGYTELINQARRDARRELGLRVKRERGHGALIQRTDLRIGTYDCPAADGAHDCWADATMTGTTISALPAGLRAQWRPSQMVISLDSERRRAARIRLGQPGTAAGGGSAPDRLDGQDLSNDPAEEPP